MQIDELIATRSQKATKEYQSSIAMSPERWASFGYQIRLPVPFSKERKYPDQNSSQAHYWELGRAGKKETDFIKLFEENTFNLEHSVTCIDHPYHRYIVFSREN